MSGIKTIRFQLIVFNVYVDRQIDIEINIDVNVNLCVCVCVSWLCLHKGPGNCDTPMAIITTSMQILAFK